MDTYYDVMRRRQHDDMMDAAKKSAESAALWGGLSGAAAQLATGNRSIPSILLRGAGVGALSAPVAAGATVAGEELLGHPSSTDRSAYTLRGGLGGAVGGGLFGGGLGYLLGSGRLRGLKHVPYAEKIAKAAHAALPLNNLIVDRLRRWAMNPSHASGLKAALLLGGTGAVFGGIQGLDEGMGLDALHGLEQQPPPPEEDDPYARYKRPDDEYARPRFAR